MSEREAAIALRGKILGVLLKDARLAAGKTPKECADVLGCSVGIYIAYELGKKNPSLPELELLAYLFGIPLSHFWGNQTLSDPGPQKQPSQLPAADLNRLRDRIIGAQLRKARVAAKFKLKEFAAELGLSAGRLSAYEFGKKPIPLPDLEVITARLGLSMEDLLERQGPVGEWDSTRREFERFRQLPSELREFVSQPLNESYLRIAFQLSQLPSDKLRSIAASLLDITY